MSTKYHLNKNSQYKQCRANKRACRYGGTHISESAFEQLASNNDVRTKPALTKKENANLPNYYRQAKNEFDLAVQKEQEYNTVMEEFNEFSSKVYEEYGIPENYNPTYNLEPDKNEIRNRIIEHYVAAGVNQRKAEYILGDIEKETPDTYKAIVKQRADRYDPLLKEHTTEGAQAINNDTELQQKISEYTHKNKMLNKFLDARSKIDAKRYSFLNEKGLSTFGDSYKSATNQAASKLGEKHNWVKAGIKDIQEVGQITDVTPEKISVNPDGSFNNLWAQHEDGTLERIESYTPPESEGYGSQGGSLITESGKSLTSFRRYHSFNRGRSVENNNLKIIIEKKNGNDYSQSNWRLYGEVDSGD